MEYMTSTSAWPAEPSYATLLASGADTQDMSFGLELDSVTIDPSVLDKDAKNNVDMSLFSYGVPVSGSPICLDETSPSHSAIQTPMFTPPISRSNSLSTCPTPNFGNTSSPATSLDGQWRTGSISPTPSFSATGYSPPLSCATNQSTPLTQSTPFLHSSPYASSEADYFSIPVKQTQHDCVARATEGLVELQKRHNSVRLLVKAGQTKSIPISDVINVGRKTIKQLSQLLDCQCFSWDDRLGLITSSTCMEIMAMYTNITRALTGDGSRKEGQTRARLGIMLGELPSIAAQVQKLSRRWTEDGATSTTLADGQEMSLVQLEKELHQRLNTLTQRLKSHCRRPSS
jgi:hypothetical protein